MQHFSGEAIILKKTANKESNSYVTLFTRQYGKMDVYAYGIKKITSRRLSHLETGNYIKFTSTTRGEYSNLAETELIWAFSKIKSNPAKLDVGYQLFMILSHILPALSGEEGVFDATLNFLTQLNNTDVGSVDLDHLLRFCMEELGFIDHATAHDHTFDPVTFAEGLVGKNLKIK